MDFEKVFEIILKEFEKKDIHYALIGGFAMGAHGILRTTMDLDFLVDSRDLLKIKNIMKDYSYNCAFESENVSQYVSDLDIFGEIDFIHAFRKTSLTIIKSSKKLPIFEGKFKINVANPEDIIGLKLQALVNNPSRETREYADIEDIMDTFKGKLNWSLMKEYFSIFEKEDKYHELEKKYGNIK